MELWDIYDRDKQRTGRTMKRNDWHMQPGDFHLTVLGVIRHTNGKYLITKRVMTKAWAPGSWEVSGGAAQAGEDSLDAVKREIKPDWMYLPLKVVLSFLIHARIRRRVTTILWTSIDLPEILQRKICICRRQRQMDIC